MEFVIVFSSFLSLVCISKILCANFSLSPQKLDVRFLFYRSIRSGASVKNDNSIDLGYLELGSEF